MEETRMPETTGITIRQWRLEDAPHIMRLERQAKEGEPDLMDPKILFKCIKDSNVMHGIVLIENRRIMGFAAMLVPKTPYGIIRALRVDESRRLHKFGTLLLNRLFTDMDSFGKIFLSVSIDVRNTGALKFLTKKGQGFVIAALNEIRDTESQKLIEATYELTCPAPTGFNPKCVRFFVNGEETVNPLLKT